MTTPMTTSNFEGAGLPLLYRGSVKDLLGPAKIAIQSPEDLKSAGTRGEARAPYIPGLIFKYSDGFSVFDWGRMGDSLPKKGAALAVQGAAWFEALEDAERWKVFSKSPEAMVLRKALSSVAGEPVSLSSRFNEMGEQLQKEGLRTHYLGWVRDVREINAATPFTAKSLQDLQNGSEVGGLAVLQVAVPRPKMTTVLGRSVADYSAQTQVPAPKLIPLEVVFRFATPEGSSLLKRLERDPSVWQEALLPRALKQSLPQVGTRWEFPLVELFTKLESTDRPLSLAEGLAISTLKAEQLEEMLIKTLWVAGFLKHSLRVAGFELADGKLEWALAPTGECFLVDAIGPDELRLSAQNQPLSKEFLRAIYRKTEWYAAVESAKEQARAHGIQDWKRLVTSSPPLLPPEGRELGSLLYQVISDRVTQALVGKSYFGTEAQLERVVQGIRSWTQSS